MKPEMMAVENAILTIAAVVREMPLEAFVVEPDAGFASMAKLLLAFKKAIPSPLPVAHGPIG